MEGNLSLSISNRFAGFLAMIARKGMSADTVLLALMTIGGLAVHGYHLGLEDEVVYLPAIKYNINPVLYPHDSVFFLEQLKFTLYDKGMAFLVRISHLRIDIFVFLAHVLSLYLILLGLPRAEPQALHKDGGPVGVRGICCGAFHLAGCGDSTLAG